jgi:hypothetical protein
MSSNILQQLFSDKHISKDGFLTITEKDFNDNGIGNYAMVLKPILNIKSIKLQSLYIKLDNLHKNESVDLYSTLGGDETKFKKIASINGNEQTDVKENIFDSSAFDSNSFGNGVHINVFTDNFTSRTNSNNDIQIYHKFNSSTPYLNVPHMSMISFYLEKNDGTRINFMNNKNKVTIKLELSSNSPDNTNTSTTINTNTTKNTEYENLKEQIKNEILAELKK